MIASTVGQQPKLNFVARRKTEKAQMPNMALILGYKTLSWSNTVNKAWDGIKPLLDGETSIMFLVKNIEQYI